MGTFLYLVCPNKRASGGRGCNDEIALPGQVIERSCSLHVESPVLEVFPGLQFADHLLYLFGIPAPDQAALAINDVTQHLELEPSLHAGANNANGADVAWCKVFCGYRARSRRTLVSQPALIKKNELQFARLLTEDEDQAVAGRQVQGRVVIEAGRHLENVIVVV